MRDAASPAVILLRVTAAIMAFGGLSSFSLVFSSRSSELGYAFQVFLAIASVLTAISAVGVWQHKKWGAYLYLLLVCAGEVVIFLLGLWTWTAVVVPGVVIITLFFAFRWMDIIGKKRTRQDAL